MENNDRRKRPRIGWILFVAILVGVSFEVGRRQNAVPDVAELEDRFAIMQTDDEIPRSDVALALWQSLEKVESDRAKPSDYTSAIHCYLILGARREAEALLVKARKAKLNDAGVEGTATTWKL